MLDATDNESTESSGEGNLITILAVSLLCLSVAILVVAVDKICGGILIRSALHDNLRRATHELSHTGTNNRRKTEPVQLPDGSTAPIPLVHSIPPGKVARIALDLEQQRQRCLSLLSRIQSDSVIGANGPSQKTRSKRITELKALWRKVQKNLAGTLRINRQRARFVLYSLAWPHLGRFQKGEKSNLPQPYSPVPPPLASQNKAVWKPILHITHSAQHKPWPAIARRLEETFNLDQEELLASQVLACRQKLNHAFRSPSDLDAARKALTRHAALTPFQKRAVLGMRAVQCLLNAGPTAFPFLLQFAEKHSTGFDMLPRAITAWGIRRQAMNAVKSFIRHPDSATSRKVIAFGPFALEAMHKLPSALTEEMGPRHWQRMSKLKSRWGAEQNALKTLGRDIHLWKQWYENARSILEDSES